MVKRASVSLLLGEDGQDPLRGADEGWGLPAGRCGSGGCNIKEDGSQQEVSPGTSPGSPSPATAGFW